MMTERRHPTRPRLRLAGGVVLWLTATAATTAAPPTPAERVRAAGAELQAYSLQHSMGHRLLAGLPIDELQDVTPAVATRDAAFARALLAKLADIGDAQLAEDDAVSLAILRHTAQEAIDAERFSGLVTPVTPYSSPLRSIRQAFAVHPFRDAADATHYLGLLEKAAAWFATLEQLLRDQSRRGVVIAAAEVPLAVGPFAAALRPAGESPFDVAPARLSSLPEAERATLLKQVQAAVETRINPALKSLVDYLSGDYAKAAPTAVGLSQYPGGADYYRFLVTAHTTQQLSPEDIHQVGLGEMDRIARALEAVRVKTGFAGDLPAFRQHLRTAARFFPATAEEIGARLMTNQQRILPRIPEFFGRTPKAAFGVERLAPALEGSMTFGYYDPPNQEHDRGLYYYNGSRLDQRSLLTSAALVAHEGVPGHHFQIALQRENAALPPFRQDYFTTAFNEGWGEYASDLVDQMGMYADPYDRAGRLMMDAHLSARLVVDTGLNALGWTRERAMAYLSENTLLSDTEAATETLRYACDMPGQALAYKMGMKKMVELRERARTALGARFDIRAFHDLVLGGGAMPLSVLEGRVDRWIKAQLVPEATTKPSAG